MITVKDSQASTIIKTVTAENPFQLAVAGDDDAAACHEELTRQNQFLVLTRAVAQHFEHLYVDKEQVLNAPRTRTYFSRYRDLLYRVQQPPVERQSSSKPRNLLVTFAQLGSPEMIVSAEYTARMTFTPYSRFPKWLVKNTRVLRISDVNLTVGSVFRNTSTYPDFEAQVAEVIAAVAKREGIARERIVLYGASKGGTAAIYHGSKLNLPFVANDPVLNVAEFGMPALTVGLRGFLAGDFVPVTNEAIAHSTVTGTVISNRYTSATYPAIQRLQGVQQVDLGDADAPTHSQVLLGDTTEVMTLLNTMLMARA